MIAPARKIVLAVVCAAQLAVPLSLVVKHEQTRAGGTPWKFQTAPVDPDDPYRGKYVRLGYSVEREPVPLAGGSGWHYGRGGRLYAELEQGPDGFARLVRLHEERPDGVEYIDVFMARFAEPPEGARTPPNAMYVRVPFDRYYLPEDRAPEVEKEYFRASREAQANTWAEVRVRDGHAALVNLVLDGKPALPER